MKFSLFYFADGTDGTGDRGRYRLLLEGARYADRHGFTAVWTPERHFHPFGGLYPNPSVTGAAVAAVTERVRIRAGSVVAPLHHIVRVAEEWSVVDNLSGGRVGLSLASGWSPRDFILRPDAFSDRHAINLAAIDTLRALWRGETYADPDGTEVTVFPPPVGPLRLWLTVAGSPDSYRAAGRAGVGVLTHLAKQSLPELAANIERYRRELAATSSEWPGEVALMLHTYLDADTETAEAVARAPLQRYLASATTLFRPGIAGDSSATAARRTEAVARLAAERYLRTDGLIGSVADAAARVKRFRDAGVDEVACLVDFGIDTDTVLHGLDYLDQLRAAEVAS